MATSAVGILASGTSPAPVVHHVYGSDYRRRRRVAGRAAAAAAAERAALAAASGGGCSSSSSSVSSPRQRQQPADILSLGRRSTLLASLQAAGVLLLSQPVQAASQDAVVRVGNGQSYASISEALQAAPSGGTVEVLGGRYIERLVITRPVTIRAAPDAAVEVSWQTDQPYQATVECGPGVEGGAVVLQGLRIRHSSPSIANNYAIKLSDSSAVLADCDITSASGIGVGIEGGAPRLLRCSVHNCERHGVAIFGDLLGDGCSAQLDGCSLVGNHLNGLLVRDGAQPTVTGCTLSGNGEWGARILDAGGRYEGNQIGANARGSVGCSMLFEEVDTARMVVENKLDRPVQFVGPRA